MTQHFAHDIITTTPSGEAITVGDIANEAREKLAAIGRPTAPETTTLEALAKDGGEVFRGIEDYGETSEPGTAADDSLDLDADDVFTE